MHHLSKVSVLIRILEGDQVHASLSTEIPSIEPVPVLELVPGLSPGEEVVVLAVLLVVLPVTTHVHPGFVEERPAIRTHPWLVLGESQEDEVGQEIIAELHSAVSV